MTVEAILLGIAQDAGVPQAGCTCDNCRRAWQNRSLRQFAASLALVDHDAGQSWLIDATPDLREQLHALSELAPDCSLAGILLTHAHVGHYAGLIQLGREVMDTRRLPIYATPAMCRFLQENAPWSQLVALENVDLRPLMPAAEVSLSPGLAITPVRVPHRNEFADTVAYVARGPSRTLFYCPDTDGWDQWGHDLREFVAAGVDVALLDATFFSHDDLPGRGQRDVPHPLVTDTVARLAGVDVDVRLIHLNHTNPLLAAGAERVWLAKQGIGLGQFGDRWML